MTNRDVVPVEPELSERARNRRGEFKRRPDAVQRRRAAAEELANGVPFGKVAETYYRGNRGNLYRAMQDHHAETAGGSGRLYREIALDKLAGLEATLREIMTREHLVVSQGRVVEDQHGNPLRDDEPVMRAIEQIRKLIETQAKLLPGMAAPKVQVEITPDQLAQMIAERERLLADELEGEGGA